MMTCRQSNEISETERPNVAAVTERGSSPEHPSNKLAEDITMSDIEILTTLGVGGFGRVELVGLSVLDDYSRKIISMSQK